MTSNMGISANIDFDFDQSSATRVVLVGFMGAGKTSLAKRWVRSGGPSIWFDSDTATLQKIGVTSIQEVIDSEGGWKRFRDVEREVIVARQDTLSRGVEVWSLGGGSLEDTQVRSVLKDACVVWLDAPVDLLWQRVAGSDRPLARDYSAFCELYDKRRAVYEDVATVRIDASDKLEHIQLGRILADYLPMNWFESDLVIGDGLLSRIEDLSALCRQNIAIVTDVAVSKYAYEIAEHMRKAGNEILTITELPMGEWNKQLSTVEGLLLSWAEHGVHRHTTIIAVGGGTLLDSAGFAASIYQRGLEWVCIPTTLTSQVDAGIGGKTGVNLGVAKNVIGSVHMPAATLIDPSLISGLSNDAIRDGFVEAAKTGVLAGERLFARAKKVAEEFTQKNLNIDTSWVSLIEGCAGYKASVVSDDPFDTDGIRAQLNLGHTLAHAIEAATGGAVTHGAAVAIGVHVALRASSLLFNQSSFLAEEWVSLCTSMGIVTSSPLSWEMLEPYLKHDKKRDEEGIAWVMMEDLGKPITQVRVPLDLMNRLWNEYIHVDKDATIEMLSVEAGLPTQPRVLVLFGVNLGQLGKRDTTHYGDLTLAELVRKIETWAVAEGMVADCRQTDDLERFIHALHEARLRHQAVIVNPGAWTHYERSLHDALEVLSIPRVEVHLSDIDKRETWRQESVIRPAVDHVIAGQGSEGYLDAIQWVMQQIRGVHLDR